MLKRTIFLVVLASFLCTGLATAQSNTRASRDDRNDRRWEIRTGLGFTAGPETFLSGIEIGYAITPNWTLGTLVQVGVEDNRTLTAPTLNSRFFPDFGQRDSSNSFLRDVRPFIHGGLGLLHVDLDRGGRDIDDTKFLFNMGFGFDFPVSKRFSVGSQMTFNVIPDSALGENFFFSWQLLNATYHF